MKPYFELTKPGVTWLIVVSAGIGYLFALPAHFAVRLDCWRLFHTLLGTGLLAGGTAALNQWWEREADGSMRRTARRPIPAGAIRPGQALWFGVAISAAGFMELAAEVNILSALLGALTLTAYLFLYTPLKRRSWLSTTVGAFPGAMPPVIGAAAASGTIPLSAVALSGILFFWQFPHFYSIAWMYREDYGRAGIRMLPVVEPDCRSTARQMLVYSLALLPASILPSMVGMSGILYAAGAIMAGAWFVRANVAAIRDPSRVHARAVLLASVVYLPALYGLLLLDRFV